MIKLDNLDIKILGELQHNGRLTKVKLADKINLSPSACHERVTRLEEKGIIASYHAELDMAQVVKMDALFVEVTLKNHQFQDFCRFEAEIKKTPAIAECLAVGGGFDYILRFIVNNISHYQEVFEGLLNKDIGIDRYFTYIVTKEVKPYRGLPLEHLLENEDEQ